MRKLGLTALLVPALLFGLGSSIAAAENIVKSDMKITLNGNTASFAQSGYLIDDSLFVPFRSISESLGGTVGWNDTSREVSLQINGNRVSFTLGASHALVNGVQSSLPSPSQLIDESTYVPLRFLSETFGLQVGYDDSARTVSLTSPAAPALQIYGVEEDSIVSGDQLQVSVVAVLHELKDFRTHMQPMAGEGHIHLWLDTDASDPKAAIKAFTAEPVVFDKLAPGEHMLTVQLVGNNHAPVQPEVKQVVHFKTEPVQTYTVDMSNFKFVPAEITIKAGSSITFTNKDADAKHNAVAVDGSFQTPLLAQGETHTLTFNTPGEYEYYCTPHKSFMTGKIIVKP